MAYDNMPMAFSSTGDLFNSSPDFNYAFEINPILYSVLPELAYDSWWTLGVEDAEVDFAAGECEPSIIPDSNQLEFLTEANWTSTGDLSIGGPLMYLLSNCSNAVPDSNNRVLIGQFTSNGGLGVELVVRGVTSDLTTDYDILLSAFTTDLFGCTDEEACNYLPLVTEEVACTYPDALGNCDGDCPADENANVGA